MRTIGFVSTLLLASFILSACGGGGGGSSNPGGSTSTGITYGANEIVFGVPDPSGSTFSIQEIKPGSAVSILATGLSSSILLYNQIPGQTNSFVIAADLANKNLFGIYRSTGLSTASPATIVSPIYSYVSSMSVSNDGKNLIYSATLAKDPSQISYLYSVSLTNGVPVQLDYSDGATLSPADNDTIVYVAVPGGVGSFDQVFTRSLSAGVSGKATQITSDQVNHLYPAVNRQGTQIAYWETGTTNTMMLQALGSNGSPVALPNPNSLVPQGEAFNSDGTQLALAADANGAGEILTQTSTAGSSPNVLYMNNSELLGNYGVYWTDLSGRTVMNSLMPSRAKRRGRLALR